MKMTRMKISPASASGSSTSSATLASCSKDDFCDPVAIVGCVDAGWGAASSVTCLNVSIIARPWPGTAAAQSHDLGVHLLFMRRQIIGELGKLGADSPSDTSENQQCEKGDREDGSNPAKAALLYRHHERIEHECEKKPPAPAARSPAWRG